MAQHRHVTSLRTRFRPARGLSLVEILIAALILAGLGAAVQTTMSQTLQGIRVDRLTEAKRNMVLDLLEMLCHPYSAIPSLFPGETSTGPLPTAGPALDPLTTSLTIDQAIGMLGIPALEADHLKEVLQAGHVKGFTLSWTRRITTGSGVPARAIRLDKLWIAVEVTEQHRGPRFDGFRVFFINNA